MFGRSAVVAPLAVLLVALFVAYGLAYTVLAGTAPEQVFNSDLVQPYMIMRDVLADPASILFWHLSPAIYVFPDYFLALALALLPLGPVATMLVNGAALGGLLILAGGYLLHLAGGIGLVRAVAVMALAQFAALLAALVLPGPLDTDMQIWTTTTFIHSGALVSGVALVGLWTRSELIRPFRPGFFAASLVLAGLAAYSDVTFLIYFVVPLVVATAVAWLPAPERGRFLRTLALLVVTLGCYLVDRLTRGHHAAGGTFTIARNVANGWDIIAPHLAGNPLVAIWLLLVPVMFVRALLLSLRALRRRDLPPGDFVEIALGGVAAMAGLVPMLFGMVGEIWHLRYMLPIAFVPLAWLTLLARRLVAGPSPLKRPRLSAGLVWVFGSAAMVPAALAALPALTAPPPVLACMDRLGLATLYAYYWDAKAPVFLSGYRVHIVQLEPDGSRSHWNTSDRWLTQSVVDGAPFAVRAIDMKGLEADSVAAIYGPPARSETCAGLTFWLYDHDLPPPPMRS